MNDCSPDPAVMDSQVTTGWGKSFGLVPQTVVKDPSLSVTARLIYTLLCCYADKGRDCFPGVERLAAEIGCSDRTVQRALVDLEDHGCLIRSAKYRDDGGQSSNNFHLASPNLAVDNSTKLGGEGDTHVTGGVTPMSPGGVTPMSPITRPVRTRPVEQTTGMAIFQIEPFAEWWNVYPRKIAKPNATRAYQKALGRGATSSALLEGLERWLPYWSRHEIQFVPHPATWLNRDGWHDEPPKISSPVDDAFEVEGVGLGGLFK